MCFSQAVGRCPLYDQYSHRYLLNFQNLQSDQEPLPKCTSCHIFHYSSHGGYTAESTWIDMTCTFGVVLGTEVIHRSAVYHFPASYSDCPARITTNHPDNKCVIYTSVKLTYRVNGLHLVVRVSIELYHALLRFRCGKPWTHSIVDYLVRRVVQIRFFATLWAAAG
jgi:hypothetical protein